MAKWSLKQGTWRAVTNCAREWILNSGEVHSSAVAAGKWHLLAAGCRHCWFKHRDLQGYRLPYPWSKTRPRMAPSTCSHAEAKNYVNAKSVMSFRFEFKAGHMTNTKQQEPCSRTGHPRMHHLWQGRVGILLTLFNDRVHLDSKRHKMTAKQAKQKQLWDSCRSRSLWDDTHLASLAAQQDCNCNLSNLHTQSNSQSSSKMSLSSALEELVSPLVWPRYCCREKLPAPGTSPKWCRHRGHMSFSTNSSTVQHKSAMSFAEVFATTYMKEMSYSSWHLAVKFWHHTTAIMCLAATNRFQPLEGKRQKM